MSGHINNGAENLWHVYLYGILFEKSKKENQNPSPKWITVVVIFYIFIFNLDSMHDWNKEPEEWYKFNWYTFKFWNS
jgi:hypothetical protein